MAYIGIEKYWQICFSFISDFSYWLRAGAEVGQPGELKMEDRKKQDWILNDHLAEAMALSAVK